MRNTGQLAIYLAVLESIEKTKFLADGWNYGRGRPSTLEARENAKLAASLMSAADIDHASVFPATDGGVMVTGYRRSESFEILACLGGGFDVVYENGNESSEPRLLSSFDALKELLEEKGWQSVFSSASFHRNIMTFESGGTHVWPSKTQRAVVCQFSNLSVRSSPLEVFARTSNVFTQDGSVVPPPRSGDLPRQKSPLAPLSCKHHRQQEMIVITI